MSEYYQENNEEKDSQPSPQNNDKAVFNGLIVFLFITFIFGVSIIGVSYFLFKYVDNQEKLTETKKIYKKIELLSTSNVSEYNGYVEFNTNGSWSQLKEKIKFENDTGFKTSADSSITIQMYNDNQIKLYSSSECLINSPEIEDSNEKIKRQIVKLTNGEITAAASIMGKGILNIEVADVTIIAQSGLFKVIYDEKEDKGEVVVKNGLVEVKENSSNSRPIKISGFYKVTFEKSELDNPRQASIILYNWR
jgi:hypothetical protein